VALFWEAVGTRDGKAYLKEIGPFKLLNCFSDVFHWVENLTNKHSMNTCHNILI
jgi:hypothetical protein